MTALDYIREKGFEHRKQGNEILLRECPFCGDTKYHFYLESPEGQFFCHKCQEKGNLITLQKHFGDYQPRTEPWNGAGSRPSKPQGSVKQAFPAKDTQCKAIDEKFILQAHERLLGDTEGMSYLERRKITPETIKAFRLGLKVDADGRRWLTIPHYQKGKVVNVKSRALPPAEKNFRRIEGCPSVLFNDDALEGAEEVFLCEGEIDTLTLWQEGIRNAVGVTCGSGTFLPEWVDQLQGAKKIFLVFDADEPGQKGAREAGRRLGFNRCFNVVLPDGQDVNEFFQDHDIFEFQALVNGARQFDVSGIISIEQGFEKFRAEIEKPEMATGLLTPWPSVNRRIRTGFQPGELIVLSAPPKIGKSTWALQICTHNALQEVPSLFFCLEMRPMKVIRKIIECHTQTPSEEIRPEEIGCTESDFSGNPLYLGYCYQKPDLNWVMETIKAAVQRYGLKMVVFDHLHFLCRSITNQTQEISLTVQAFKFLAEEMEIPIILIAQPRKIEPDKKSSAYPIMTAMDLKDSISIYSDCDHLIILHRQRKASMGKEVKEGMETHDQAFEPVTLVRVEASRYNAGGEALLYYHGEYSRFDEIEK
jgi:hypothetical protein